VKKLLVALCLSMVLCLLCGAALADHPTDEETGAYVHEYNVDADESKVIVWPTGAGSTGLIRFPCAYAGENEYEDPEAEGYLPAAQDFQEYVVYAKEFVFPEDLEEALELVGTDREVKYVPATCTKAGTLVVANEEFNKSKSYQTLTYDGVKFYGWQGAFYDTKEFTIPAGHKWSDDDEWDSLRKEQGMPQYHFIKEATCTEQGILRPYCLVCGVERGDEVYTDPIAHNWDYVETVAPTCKTEGKEVYQCTMCGKAYDGDDMEEEDLEHVLPVNQNAHQFGDWITESEVTKAPTCEEAGSYKKTEYRLCKICLNAKEVNTTEKELEPLGHYKKDDKGVLIVEVNTCVEHTIKYICPRCKTKTNEYVIAQEEKEIDKSAHPLDHWKMTSSEAATCEEDGIENYECDLCGATGTKVLPALGHDLDWEHKGNKFIPGTCGKTEEDEVPDVNKVWCKRCEDFVEIEGEVPDHEWTKWTCRVKYNQDGLDTPAYWIRQCEKCGKHEEIILNSDEDMNGEEVDPGDIVPVDPCAEGHTYEVTEEVAATPTTKGKKVYTCSVCGDSYEEEVEFVPTADPAYNLKGVDYDGEYITGSVEHDASTKDSDQQFIRATYFFANGTTSIVVSVVNADGTFDIGLTGDVAHVTLVVTGTGRCVRPDGSWISMGVYEF